MPTNTDWKEPIGRAVLTGKIIVAALVTGPSIFLVVVLLLTQGQAAVAGQPMLTYMAAAFALLAIVLRAVAPAATVANRRRQMVQRTYRPGTGAANSPGFQKFLAQTGDAGLLFQLYLTKTIIAAALLEGAAFFLLTAYMIERHVLALGMALVLLTGIAMLMPSREGVFAWIEGQLARIEQERRLGNQ